VVASDDAGEMPRLRTPPVRRSSCCELVSVRASPKTASGATRDSARVGDNREITIFLAL